MERAFVPIKVAVMLVSDAPSTLDEATGKLVVDKLTEAGHEVAPIEVVSDAEHAVRKQIDAWIDFSDVDVIIAISGFETDATHIALAPLITKQLTGFSDLFRLLTYREIGTAAMLTEVIAAQCGHAFVFALPAARGAVATALDKLLIPQLDCRTRPRNLVMRMPRHKAKVPTTGPLSFPPSEETPAGVPPPPRSASKTLPPPLPRRSSAVHSTPPMPVVAVPRTISDPNITELDPTAVIEEPASTPALSLASLEEAIERSIESSGAELDDELKATKPTKLDDNDPAVVAAREHAEKTPAAQAAAWAAAVEEAASKSIKKTAAERAEREARRSGEHKIPEVTTDAEAKPAEAKPAEPADAKPAEAKPAKPEPAEDEPRGKIEKASGSKAPQKPDRPVDNVAAVIVDDPDLVEKRSKAASISPANKPPPARAVEPTDLPVFPARQATPAPAKTNRSWMIVGALALIGAVLLLVNVIGKRDTKADKPQPPIGNPDPIATNPPTGDPPITDPPVADPPVVDPPVTATADAAELEMEPTNARGPRPIELDPRPRPRKGSDDAPKDPDDPDLTKAPDNPAATDECDQVSCVLTKFEKPCCAPWKPKEPPPVDAPPPVDPSAGPLELDKTLIKVGVERYRALIIRCGEQVAAKGTVMLSVTVKPDGNVASVAVASAPDAALGECAAGVMRKATFARTQNGGSFSYPFVF